ncbi:MAG: hypothetical protein R2851_20485 [Caldilineaceae bacterium]
MNRCTSTKRACSRWCWWWASTALGKTTTIGKMANWYKGRGRKVVLGAADTFALRPSTSSGPGAAPAWT